MERSGRKKSDGIKRLKKTKRTRVKARSFNDEVISVDINSRLSNRAKRKLKKSDGIIRNTRKKTKPVVLVPEQKDELPSMEFNRGFYTPPKRISQKKDYIRLVKTFFIKNKKIIIPAARILGVFIILFLIINQNHKAIVRFDSHIEYQDFDESITVYKNPKENQLGFNVIALSDEESISIIASDERAIEKKASGEITIFNDFSTQPQRLLPETRFETAGGEIFKLGNKEVIIPGKTGSTSGKITAVVFADKPGEKQNIDVTDFTIPGYKEAGLDEKYNGIYAVSNQKFKGGFVGVEAYISDVQKEIAEKNLKEKLEKRLLLKLEKEKTDQVVIIDGTKSIEYKDSESIFDNNNETGVMSQRGMIFALLISQKDINQYINNNFTDIPEGEVAVVKNINNLLLSKEGEGVIDYEAQKSLTINASGSSLLEWQVDNALLVDDIGGLDEESLVNYFQGNNTIDTAHIDLRPFWKKSVPKNIDAIVVK